MFDHIRLQLSRVFIHRRETWVNDTIRGELSDEVGAVAKSNIARSISFGRWLIVRTSFSSL